MYAVHRHTLSRPTLRRSELLRLEDACGLGSSPSVPCPPAALDPRSNAIASRALAPRPRLIWIGVSLALVVVGSNVGWLVARLARRYGLAWLVRSSIVQAFAWLIRSLVFMALPLLAWRQGVISPNQLGLGQIDWVATLSTAALPAVVLVGLAIFGWLVYRHTLHAADEAAGPPPDRAPTGEQGRDGRLVTAVRTALGRRPAPVAAGILSRDRHRCVGCGGRIAPAPGVFGSLPGDLLAAAQANAVYWGVWAGVVLYLLEGALDPFVWQALKRPGGPDLASGKAEAIFLRIALAFATSALFVLSRNLWLCLACQVIVETALAGWLPLHDTKKDEEGSPLPRPSSLHDTLR